MKKSGLSQFGNYIVSHSQPLQMVNDAKINKWLCCRDPYLGCYQKNMI